MAILDYAKGTLSAGTHTIAIETDIRDALAEISKADDEYTKTVMRRLITLSRARPSLSPWRSREWVGQRMQDVERVTQIQSLAQPGRARRSRVEAESLCVVLRPQSLGRIRGHYGQGRYLGQQPAVRPPESERAVGLSIDLIALLMHRSMVSATEQREV